ncbi:MAG: hypothetical protein HRT53_02500 [Colwellia sp.]|nr:hypothetical protein [Colwellia sp.]
MEIALNEVKIQAKKLLKASRLDNDLLLTMELPLKRLGLSLDDEIKLKHCLTIVSQQLGFTDWHHALDVLSGSKKNIDALDMGTLFYPKGADGFINEWFANYQQAKNTLSGQAGGKWLLPYKNQFIVVKKDYISTFKLDEKLMLLWAEIDHNMVDGYKSVAWDKLTCRIIKNRSKNY